MSKARFPLIEAHRGNSSAAPENTLAAFRQAIDLGVTWIELDVHAAADGEIVVMHDDTVDRTTDGSGAIVDLSGADIKRLDAGSWFGADYAGEPVPFLDEVVELVGDGPVCLNVEVKGVALGGSTAQRIVSILRSAPHGRRHLISSFDLASLLAMRAACPDMVLAMLGSGKPALDAALEHDLPWVHSSFDSVDPALVQRAHDASVRVMAWTVDEVEPFRRLAAMGVDKVCTNRPRDLLAAQPGEI